jgi:hypothetical protein
MSGGHGHLEGSNKNIAILIAVLADSGTMPAAVKSQIEA